MNEMQILQRLHTAADCVANEAGTPRMDAIATAGAQFMRESHLTDEYGKAVPFTEAEHVAFGYGILLGWLAREIGP